MASILPARVVKAPARGVRAQSSAKRVDASTSQGSVAVRTWALDVAFALRGVAIASGAKWNATHSVFAFVGADLPPALRAFEPLLYSLEHYVQSALDEEAGIAPAVPIAAKPALTPSLRPRPHQQQAVRAIVAAHREARPGFLLADDVGLGKTISAWEAMLGIDAAERVLIVAPLSVLAHWRRTIEAMGDRGKTIVILNYDRLGKLFEVTPAARKKVRSKKGLARAGTAPEFDVIIWDESHRCKNPTAARSKFAAKLTNAADFSLWLSATAGQNPLELSYLAPLLASVTGSRASDLKDFEAWCQEQGMGLARGNYGKWEWRGDPEDCRKVRALLFDPRAGKAPAGLRRRPEEIVGWPAINRILAPIELDGEARALYKQAWTAFREEMALAPRGDRNPKGALAAALRLRQKSSLIRASGSAELVRELLDNGHQVAVSVAFRETLEVLREALSGISCAEIHGGLSAQEREAERMRFQRGEAQVVLFTVEEGISLHQGEHVDIPRSEVIHDLRWSAIQMAQIEGRCHRDGRFAQVYWAYADGTVEERIARVVVQRIQSMKEMIGDDTETLREIEALLAAGE
jgi:superfamily II DNA or RNA helicase